MQQGNFVTNFSAMKQFYNSRSNHTLSAINKSEYAKNRPISICKI